MGSTSSWSFWISLKAERALGFLGFCLTSSLLRKSFLGHLVVTVGGLGVAVALLAKSRGGCTVSTTVSVCKVGVSNASTAGKVSSTGVMGGCACRSCTRSQTSHIVWGGELACSTFSRSTALLTSGDSTPVKVGVRLVQSASPLGSWSCFL